MLTFVGYDDTFVFNPDNKDFSIYDSFHRWGEVNKCTGDPIEKILEGIPGGKDDISYFYNDCDSGVRTGLYTINVPHDLYPYWGKIEYDIAGIAWEFLSAFRLPK